MKNNPLVQGGLINEKYPVGPTIYTPLDQGVIFHWFFPHFYKTSASISAMLTGPIVSEAFHEEIHTSTDV